MTESLKNLVHASSTIYGDEPTPLGSKISRENGIQVIARAAAVLNALGAELDGLSLGQIAARVNLPRSTIQRIVYALESEGLVSATQQGVKLGPTIARLGSLARMDVKNVARPHLQALAREVNETVDLSMLVEDQFLFIDQVVSDRKLRIVSSVGAMFPLYCTAHGKAYLAQLPDEQVKNLLFGKMRRHTANTITDIDQLIRQLGEVRATGYGYDFEEHSEDVSAVGTMVDDSAGLQYALSITVPASRFTRNFKELTLALGKCKSAIQETLNAARV
jgi:DNA-binding IclR family transcriptional regulator